MLERIALWEEVKGQEFLEEGGGRRLAGLQMGSMNEALCSR